MRFLCEPGEPLVSPTPPLLAAQRAIDMHQTFGLPVVSSLWCATPIPAYPLGQAPTVESLRHPLLWLPDQMWRRRALDDNTRMEDDDEWAARIGFEMTAAGLYDTGSGEWVDVLDAAGLDPVKDAGRIRTWQAQGGDDDLDSVDLSVVMATVNDPDLGMDWVQANLADMRRQVWLATLDEMSQVAPGLDAAMLPVAVGAWLAGLFGCPGFDGFVAAWQEAASAGQASWLAGQATQLASQLAG